MIWEKGVVGVIGMIGVIGVIGEKRHWGNLCKSGIVVIGVIDVKG